MIPDRKMTAGGPARPPLRTPVRTVVATVALAAVLGACTGTDNGTGTAAPRTGDPAGSTVVGGPPAAGRVESEGITVDRAWARTSPAGAVSAAVYLRITASAPDTLLGAAVDPDVAASAQLHETVMSPATTVAGSAAPSMTMREVDRVTLTPGVALELKPGGYHLMLVGLARPLVRGETIGVTLSFEHAGPVALEVPVADNAPS